MWLTTRVAWGMLKDLIFQRDGPGPMSTVLGDKKVGGGGGGGETKPEKEYQQNTT